MTAAPQPEPPVIEQDLCTSCGMCCDGTMFDHVQVKPDEQTRLAEHFTLHRNATGAVFDQPCPHARHQRCMIYELRPHTCRTYRCTTLTAFQADEITHAEAVRRIDEALAARTRTMPLINPGETLARARLRRSALASAPTDTAKNARFILTLTALDMLLDRYFRKPDKTMFAKTPL